MNKPEYFIIHTEASPVITTAPRFDVVNQYHRTLDFPKSSLGWYVGYHFFIEKSGKLIQAKLDSDEGAHTKGYNLCSLGICLAGNGDEEMPTAEQTATLKNLLTEKSKQYNIPTERIVPHRHFLEHREKTCYGRLLSDSWAASLVSYMPQPDIVQKITLYRKLIALYQQLIALLQVKKVGGRNDHDHCEI